MLGCKDTRHNSIREDVANAVVEEALIAWFSNKPVARAALMPDGSEVEGKTAAAQRLINGYEEQLREARTLAKTFNLETGRPRLSMTGLADIEEDLGPKLEAERAKLRELTGVSPVLLDLLTAEDPDMVWNGRPATAAGPAVEGLTLEQKREVIRRVLTIRLRRASRAGGRRVEPERVMLSFFGEPGFRDRSLRAPENVPAAAPDSAPARGPASGTE